MGRLNQIIGWNDLRETGFQIWRPLLAELIGTELLVLLAVGSGIWSGGNPLHVSLAAGFSVAVIIESVAHVSGGHINPAVTAGVMAVGHMSLLRGLLYIIAQLLGGLIAAGILKVMTPFPAPGVTLMDPQLSVMQGVTIESIITFVLVFAALATLDPNRTDIKISPPFVIGLSVAIGHLYALKATGASMNPARSFGSAVVSGIWTHHWIYWLGPISGGISGAITYRLMFAAPPVAKNTSQELTNTNTRLPNKNGSAESSC